MVTTYLIVSIVLFILSTRGAVELGVQKTSAIVFTSFLWPLTVCIAVYDLLKRGAVNGK